MAKKKTLKPSNSEIIRVCANIRSRKHPDVRCIYTASHGDFCTRHYKNPTRFQEIKPINTIYSISEIKFVKKIQTWWKLYSGYLRFRRQGPAVHLTEISENQTDIFSLDSIHTVPIIYRWSYIDLKKHVWFFDVRSLNMIRAHDSSGSFLNPYTREKIPESLEKKFHDRCTWLRTRKYCLVHSVTNDLSLDQMWHQKILDVTVKYDMLGYHTCLHWFEELSIRQLAVFYTELWELWFYRLQLDPVIKKQVVPNWNKEDTLLFKWNPIEIVHRNERRWWQKTVLEILDSLVSSAELKEHRILGALYGMTAFAIVSHTVREHYPWLVEI